MRFIEFELFLFVFKSNMYVLAHQSRVSLTKFLKNLTNIFNVWFQTFWRHFTIFLQNFESSLEKTQEWEKHIKMNANNFVFQQNNKMSFYCFFFIFNIVANFKTLFVAFALLLKEFSFFPGFARISLSRPLHVGWMHRFRCKKRHQGLEAGSTQIKQPRFSDSAIMEMSQQKTKTLNLSSSLPSWVNISKENYVIISETTQQLEEKSSFSCPSHCWIRTALFQRKGQYRHTT